MRQRKKMATKFNDANPDKTEFCGIIGIGPFTKNTARLNDPAKELMIKEMMGKISGLSQSISDTVTPLVDLGKSEEVRLTIANDMWD